MHALLRAVNESEYKHNACTHVFIATVHFVHNPRSLCLVGLILTKSWGS